ncbi:MAG: hypothetical protein ACNFW9_04705 [Candidatus Kerfeldbacteria bacterium]|jgi:hypothetical protein
MPSQNYEDRILDSFNFKATKLFDPSRQEDSDKKILSLFVKQVKVKKNKGIADSLVELASVYVSPNKLLLSVIILKNVSDDMVSDLFFTAIGYITAEELLSAITLIKVNRYPLFEILVGKILQLTDLEDLIEDLVIIPGQA